MGKVMLLRTCGPAGESHGGFVWPMTVGAEVVAPDWNPSPECGGGLHGLLWGEGDCSLIPTDGPRVWMACEADEADVVRIDSTKAKARSVRIVACGTREDATQAVYRAAPNGTRVHYLSMTGGAYSTLTGGDYSTLTGGDGSTLTGGDGSTLTGGYGSTLTGGDYSTLTGGYGSTLTGGDYSTLTGGYRSTLTGGDYSTLTGGYGSTLTGGDYSTLTGGYRSTLTGGDGSTLVWRIWDGLHRRIHVAYVGEDGIEPGVAYRWENGKATKVTA